jgi:CheY-like chemotaxis protein
MSWPRILMVNDKPARGSDLHAALATLDYTVVATVSAGQAAERLAAKTPPHRVLMTAPSDALALEASRVLDAHLGKRIRTSQGQLKWPRGSSHPRPMPDGSLLWDGVLLDFTERKQAEAALRDVDRVSADCDPGWPPDVLAGRKRNIGLRLVYAIIEQEMGGAVTALQVPGSASGQEDV